MSRSSHYMMEGELKGQNWDAQNTKKAQALNPKEEGGAGKKELGCAGDRNEKEMPKQSPPPQPSHSHKGIGKTQSNLCEESNEVVEPEVDDVNLGSWRGF